MAGPKGYGLAMAIDVLGGVLTGSLFGKHITSLFGNTSIPQNVGHFVVVVNVEHFIDRSYYNSQIALLIEGLREVEPLSSVDKIYLPGEIEYLKYLENKEKGVAVGKKSLSEVESVGRQMGLDPGDYSLYITK